MKATQTYLNIFRAEFGSARTITTITREQLRALLVKLAQEANLDLRGYAHWYGADENAPLEDIARAIANAPQGSTLLSLGGHVRDIQFDQPGSMNPSQHAELSFVSAELAAGEHDYDRENHPGSTMEYLRRHAQRVITVTGAKLEGPPKPAETDHCSVTCDNGHRWNIPRAEHPEALDRCPKCGLYWQ